MAEPVIISLDAHQSPPRTQVVVAASPKTPPSRPGPSSNFKKIKRVSALLPKEELSKIIREFEDLGIPLIVEGFHNLPDWKPETLSPEWLVEHYPGPVTARNVCNREDKKLELSEFIEVLKGYDEPPAPGESVRLYGKDLPCPKEWEEQLAMLPPELLSCGPRDSFGFLNPEDRPETLMTYIGVGSTFTPSHKDSCASMGHNLMTYAARSAHSDGQNGNNEPETWADWFMTSSADSVAASKFFREKLNAELDLEIRFAKVEELRAANFTVWICRQVCGDLVLVPSMSCHQVHNYGGISIKVSWSRMPLASLKPAIEKELPIYRRVGRPEVYRVKMLVSYAVAHLSENYPSLDDSERDQFRSLLSILSNLHVEEWHPHHNAFLFDESGQKSGQAPSIQHITCDCCGADILQSYLECKRCTMPDTRSDWYTICPTCYVEGRSCPHRIMNPRMLRPWDNLLQLRNRAAALLGERIWELDDYNRSDHLSVFQAACIVVERRRRLLGTAKTEMRCHTKIWPAHSDLPEARISCKKCHRSVCLAHTLIMRVHAVDALIVSEVDPTQEIWHSYHGHAKTRWPDTREDDPRKILINAVQNHPKCRPCDPRTVLGWYDEKSPLVKPETNIDEIELGVDDETPLSSQTNERKRKRDSSIFIAPDQILRRRVSKSNKGEPDKSMKFGPPTGRRKSSRPQDAPATDPQPPSPPYTPITLHLKRNRDIPSGSRAGSSHPSSQWTVGRKNGHSPTNQTSGFETPPTEDSFDNLLGHNNADVLLTHPSNLGASSHQGAVGISSNLNLSKEYLLQRTIEALRRQHQAELGSVQKELVAQKELAEARYVALLDAKLASEREMRQQIEDGRGREGVLLVQLTRANDQADRYAGRLEEMYRQLYGGIEAPSQPSPPPFAINNPWSSEPSNGLPLESGTGLQERSTSQDDDSRWSQHQSTQG